MLNFNAARKYELFEMFCFIVSSKFVRAKAKPRDMRPLQSTFCGTSKI